MITRWDYIKCSGKKECAKAMAFLIVKTTKYNQNLSCEELIGYVKSIQSTIEEWLSEEIIED